MELLLTFAVAMVATIALPFGLAKTPKRSTARVLVGAAGAVLLAVEGFVGAALFAFFSGGIPLCFFGVECGDPAPWVGPLLIGAPLMGVAFAVWAAVAWPDPRPIASNLESPSYPASNLI